MMNTGEKIVNSKNKMLSTIAYQINNKTNYAIEGSVFTGGSLVQWLRDQLKIISNASEIESLSIYSKRQWRDYFYSCTYLVWVLLIGILKLLDLY